MAVCAFCGKAAKASSAPSGSGEADASADDSLPLTWVTSVENGRERVYCDDCSRAHLRSIESKLDSEWW